MTGSLHISRDGQGIACAKPCAEQPCAGRSERIPRSSTKRVHSSTDAAAFSTPLPSKAPLVPTFEETTLGQGRWTSAPGLVAGPQTQHCSEYHTRNNDNNDNNNTEATRSNKPSRTLDLARAKALTLKHLAQARKRAAASSPRLEDPQYGRFHSCARAVRCLVG